MDEDELEDILDVVGGFSKERNNPPSVSLPKKEVITVQQKPLVQPESIQPKVVAKKTVTRKVSVPHKLANHKSTTGKSTPQIKTATLVANDHLEEISSVPKKRYRKTKREGLIEKVKNYQGDLMGDKYTSARTRKILIQLNKFIYPDLKNYQIIEFLLLQSIDQNQELLPPNFKDLI